MVYLVLKIGNLSAPNNYCPISFTSVISKVFETADLRLAAFVSRTRTTAERSSIRTPTSSYHWWFADSLSVHVAVEFFNHGKTHLVSIDISKTLDQVWEEGILTSLPKFGFSSALIPWTSFSP